jgi:uncharacterized protein
MARKKAQRKQETDLVPHRTQNFSELLERAKTGSSAQAVKAYLDAGGYYNALVQTRGPGGLIQAPLLHSMAVTNAHPHKELAESVRLLVAAGADINAAFTDRFGFEKTALVWATSKRCCSKLLQVFLECGADPCLLMRSAQFSATALHVAATVGLPASCEVLLAHTDALLEVRDSEGQTALTHAAANGHLDTVKLLLRYGADIDTVDKKGRTPLFAAGLHQRVNVVAPLVEAGADVNAVDSDGNGVLMASVKHNNTALVQLLLSSGADISMQNRAGRNAMFTAAGAGHKHMLELLVQHGLSVTVADNSGNTLLMTAATCEHTAAAEWLIQQGVAIDAARHDGGTALHSACSDGSGDNTAMIELLLANGADVNKSTIHNETALAIAAKSGKLQCAKALIAAGADVNVVSVYGATSLHVAVTHGRSAVAQLLLEHGGAAVINSYVPVQCVLGAECCDGVTALMLCSTAETIKLLLAAGADVHATTNSGDTCVHKAAAHGSAAPVVCLLIKAGVDIHAVNNKGKTAAQVAHDVGNTLIEQLLNRAAQQGH